MNEKRFSGEPERLRRTERRTLLEIDKVVDHLLSGQKISSVLDVGTGTGLFAEEFALRQLKVTGVDCNHKYLKIADEMVSDGIFKQAVAEALPFAKASFDLVFMGHVLHETDDPQKAVDEAFRVSRKLFAVLEWPYLEQEKGPPLHHRIRSQQIKDYGLAAGFAHCDLIELKHMHLFIFNR